VDLSAKSLMGLLTVAVVASTLIGPGAPAARGDHDALPHSTGDPDRRFELVSPSYKVAGIGVGTSYSGPGNLTSTGHAAHAGDRFAVGSDWGSMLLDSAAYAFANDWAFADRVGDQVGWMSHTPITHPLSKHEPTRFLRMQTATPDLSKVVWTGNGGPIPLFQQMASDWPNAASSFVTDWEGRWELFGPTDPGQVPAGTIAEILTAPALSADGLHVVGSGPIRGMEGSRDPSHPSIPGLAGRSVYDLDLSGGITDAFPVPGMRKLVNVCTGDGPERTVIPSRTAGGLLTEQMCPGALAGRDYRLISDRGASLVRGSNSAPGSTQDGLVSNNGRRMFFMAPDPDTGDPDGIGPSTGGSDPCGASTDAATSCPAQLYVRERGVDGVTRTRWISRAQPGLLGSQQASLTGPALFEGASEDGSRVFFRTSSPLTFDDPNGVKDGGGNVVSPLPEGVTTGLASNDSWDLYMFEFAPGPDGDPATPDGDPTGPGSKLTRITAGPTGIADPNGLQITGGINFSQGVLRFASDDGSRAYFAVSGQLPGVTAPPDPSRLTAPGGDHTTATQANLYAYDAGEPAVADRWRFVARLPRAVDGNPLPSPQALSACATTAVSVASPLSDPNGSSGAIDFAAGGRNCVRGTSDGAFITLWTPGQLLSGDAGASVDVYGYDLDADELIRISAAQGGVGGTYPCGHSIPGQVSVAAAFQCHGDGGLEIGGVTTQTPNPILGVATDPPVPGDRIAFFQSRSRLVPDDMDDAYDVYQWRNGVLSLLTTGASASDGAIYRGNDRSGRNVYFATVDSLTWQDVDAVADVYVARLGGGIPRPIPAPVCQALADGCQGPGGVVAGGDRMATSVTGGGKNTAPAARARLAVRGLGARARRRAARSGVIRLRVRPSEAGRVRAVARARLGSRWRVVGRTSRRFEGGRSATMQLRLSRVVVRRLRAGERLKVRVRIAMGGARPRTVAVALRKPER
jgi:hypothetical protein